MRKLFNLPHRRGKWLVLHRDEHEVCWRAGRRVTRAGAQILVAPRAREGEVVVDAATLTQWIAFLVDHCYLVFGDGNQEDWAFTRGSS